MNIVIVGAGSVGFNLAEQLSAEGHDISVIDQSGPRARRMNDRMDVLAVEGNATSPSVMEKARIAEADTLVPGVRYGDRMVNYKSILDGIVTRIHVSKGNVIGAGNDLVTMVSSMAPLEAVAYVQNQDIGQLRRGQPVKIKYFAYPFQEWGIQLGTISEISTKPSGEAGRESMYTIRVALDTEIITKKRTRPRKLEMGLEGVAEVKTGEKRLISIVFSPFARFFEEPGGDGDGGDGDDGGGEA